MARGIHFTNMIEHPSCIHWADVVSDESSFMRRQPTSILDGMHAWKASDPLVNAHDGGT